MVSTDLEDIIVIKSLMMFIYRPVNLLKAKRSDRKKFNYWRLYFS